ncbi:DNA repair protein RAD50, putative [Plasmodium ovale]|uniref:DNA repair protein RAD50, putative n=2 Tax=Plasmodium ovale TaxID=36330 RepID=A0A1D3TJP0_PLAOA|nr:DNA repair protein RAD50, putative (RAD50) [Plasmodium ovale curtisi]SBS95515.1 DNA repair protein RAD50, putative (RAD50) [Plasmodium ovale curtisi]SCP05203.1 DNA repair protein RAD50, putative [Plasmodium ovale]
MTTLERIGIRGIRSYCDEEVQQLDFASPITVIYGNNGSGKSTIVECLKVSCTGDFPPNAEKGKSFVHDPLISNKMNIRGKIDLLLKNYNNKRIGISRSFNLFYSKDKNKKIKHTFRSLDNNIIIKKEKGEDIIITNKCVDINSHIPKLMGVSKALLENVIFCHHEDSLWPFSESIKIKKKFDELFGDDHFSKILDELLKCKKTVNDIIKKKEYELVHIKNCFEKKKNIHIEIEKNEKEIENAKVIMLLDQKKFKENSTMLDSINNKNTILCKLINDINTYTIVNEKYQSDIQQYRNIKEIYEENSMELTKFAQILKEDLSRCNNIITEINLEITKLELESEQCLQSYDQFNIKECDLISTSIETLNRNKSLILHLINCISHFDSTFLNIKGKHMDMDKLISNELKKLHLIILDNKSIFIKKSMKWDTILDNKKDSSFFFHMINILIDNHNVYITNPYYPKEDNPIDVILYVRKKHNRRIKMIRYFIKQKIYEIRKNNKNKNKVIQKIKLYKDRITKIEINSKRIEKWIKWLSMIKSEEYIYQENLRIFEKMKQLQCVYNSINSYEMDDINLPGNYEMDNYDEKIESEKLQLRKMTDLKWALGKILRRVTNCNVVFQFFLDMQKFHTNVRNSAIELFSFFHQMEKFHKMCNLTGGGNYDMELHMLWSPLTGENRNAGKDDSRRDDSKIDDSRMDDSRMDDSRMDDSRMDDSRIDDSRKDDSRMDDPRMDDSRMDDSRRDEAGGDSERGCHADNGEKSNQLEKSIPLEKFEAGTQGAHTGKREYITPPADPGSVPKRRKRTFEWPYFDYLSNLQRVNSTLENYVHKCEEKIEAVHTKIQSLREQVTLTSRNLYIAEGKMKTHLNVVKRFYSMLEEKQLKNVNDLIFHLSTLKKDIKRVKMNIASLHNREESLYQFEENALKLGVCSLCKTPIDEPRRGDVTLDVNLQSRETHKEVENLERELYQLRGKKEELIPILVNYHNYVAPSSREATSLNNNMSSMKKELEDVQSNLHMYSQEIRKIDEMYTRSLELKARCTHLVSKGAEVASERDALLARREEIKQAIFSLRGETLWEGEVLRPLLSLLEGGGETGEVGMIAILEDDAPDEGEEGRSSLRKLRDFVHNFIKVHSHREVMTFVLEDVSSYVESDFTIWGDNRFNRGSAILREKGTLEREHSVREKKYINDGVTASTAQTQSEGTSDSTGEEILEEEEKHSLCLDDMEKEEANGTVVGENTTYDTFSLLNNGVKQCKDGKTTSSYNALFAKPFEEEEENFHEWEKRFFFSGDYLARKVELVISMNEKFEREYDKMTLCINAEEIKKKERIDMIHKMKCMTNDRKEYIKEKIHKLENSLHMENKIRECLRKMEKYIENSLEKKKYLYNCIDVKNTDLMKFQRIGKYIRKSLRNGKNCILMENKIFYVKVHLVRKLLDDIKNIEEKKMKEEKNFKKIKEKRDNNEIVKSTSNEITHKIKEKKEKLLCLQEERVNIEMMYHNIIVNTNLKKMHESYLNHQREFITSVNDLKNFIFLEQNVENEFKDINSIVNMLEHIYRQNCDIYTFIHENFNFLTYQNKLLQILNNLKERLQEKIEIYTDSVTKIKIKQAEIKGKISLRNEYIDRLRQDINSKVYMNIENEYKKKIIEIFVYKNVIKDIYNFYNSFDQAIIKFHSLKMQEINISIKNLWRRVYNNSDIDYICIKSDIDTENNGKINQRRSYNYRVVMVKDNFELDMKGRCSSGQKVLSSIIIRLALAESFSIKCGILALDEPTTNLDKTNSRNLANLISNIVDLRKDSSAFQLILITHDTYFVDALSQYGLTNCFYKIRKDDHGYSRIEKILN